MKLPVLDIFVLSLLDRGAETAYDLHRSAGLSLGATLPSLKRLAAQGLIRLAKGKTSSKRPRIVYALTPGRARCRAQFVETTAVR